MPIHCKFFQEIEEEEIIPNPFYQNQVRYYQNKLGPRGFWEK